MKKIYHHYTKWEEHINGMWRKVNPQTEKEYLDKAIKFTGNDELYGKYMLKVINCWPISCEQNLSDTGMNRQAWIGHAACCLAIDCPEYITRQAWWNLTTEQQNKANKKADEAIYVWEQRQILKDSKQLILF